MLRNAQDGNVISAANDSSQRDYMGKCDTGKCLRFIGKGICIDWLYSCFVAGPVASKGAGLALAESCHFFNLSFSYWAFLKFE